MKPDIGRDYAPLCPLTCHKPSGSLEMICRNKNIGDKNRIGKTLSVSKRGNCGGGFNYRGNRGRGKCPTKAKHLTPTNSRAQKISVDGEIRTRREPAPPIENLQRTCDTGVY